MYYNPGGIGFADGTHIYIDANTAYRSASYDRPASAIDNPGDDANVAANSGEATLSNIVVAPMVGVTTDFGVDMPLKFGTAFFVPFGGSAVWDTAESSAEHPGAEYGSQRWYAIEGSITTLGIAAGAAYRIDAARLSIGLTGNLYLSSINTIRARNADGTDDLTDGDLLKEGRSWLDVKSTDFGLGAGVLWEAWRRKAWVGLSYQSAPNFNGKLTYEGSLSNLLGTQESTTDDQIRSTGGLPDIIRWGIRVRPNARHEVRLFGDVTFWSRFDQQCIYSGASVDNPDAACEVNDDGSRVNPDEDSIVQVLRRNYSNAFGIRLGYSYWFNKDLELQLGAGFDGNAIPDEHVDPALMDMNKVSAAAFIVYNLTDWFAFQVGATEILYFERDLSESKGNNDLTLPSRQPGNQGVYNQNILVLNTGFFFNF